MEDVMSRLDFCEKMSNCLINILNQKYRVNKASDRCLIQRTRHPALKKLGDFHLSKILVKYLEMKYAAVPDEKVCFNLGLFEAFDLLIRKSHTWSVPLIFWKDHGGGFVFGVSRFHAFSHIIPKTFEVDDLATSQWSSENAMILCHVNTNPVLHDLRTLVYCDVLCNILKGKCNIFISKDQEVFSKCLYEELFRDLNFEMDLTTSAKVGAHTLKSYIAPTCFADCLQDDEKSYPYLKERHYHGNRTAFASKVLNNYKNSVAHLGREFMSQQLKGTFRCIHVCNQTNFLLAQQSELFHAWYKGKENGDTKHLYTGHCDQFFSHSGIRATSSLSTNEFLEKRAEQIKEAFESKLAMTTDDGEWKDIFKKVRAGLIRLELLKNSRTSAVKLKDSLPADAVFILYNYSRLCMLMEKYFEKVNHGDYPSIPVNDADFACLQEEAEWELVVDHLWTLHDAVQTINPVFKEHTLEINCHHLIEYLHRLCHSVSTYYSRYHILGEGLPHLIPTVTARMYLMKAVKKAMDHVFQLIGVDPVSQM